jgi:hypothetical protein
MGKELAHGRAGVCFVLDWSPLIVVSNSKFVSTREAWCSGSPHSPGSTALALFRLAAQRSGPFTPGVCGMRRFKGPASTRVVANFTTL